MESYRLGFSGIFHTGPQRSYAVLHPFRKLKRTRHLEVYVSLGQLVDNPGFGDEEGETLLEGLLARTETPSLQHFVRSMVGMDRSIAQAAFSGFLADRSLTPQQIRFVELTIDQLTTRGVMEASALYEPPFSNLHTAGPDVLFSGKEPIIEGIFQTLREVHSNLG